MGSPLPLSCKLAQLRYCACSSVLSEPSLGLLRALAVFVLASFSSIPITLIRDHLCLFN